jgi:hypothetical protein
MNLKYKNESGELFVDPIVENHDGLIAITDEEFDAIVEANQPAPNDAEIRSKAMYDGIDIEGVMCSALKEDQWGLNSVKEFVVSGATVPFEFANGNVLVLTPENIADFEATWIPFRFSFFQ